MTKKKSNNSPPTTPPTSNIPDRPFILIEFAADDSASMKVTPVRVTSAMWHAAAMYMFGAALQNIFQNITQGQVAAAQQQAELQSIMAAQKK